jgi:hypothetical protein
MAGAIPSGLLSSIKCPHRGFQNVRAHTMIQHCFDEHPIDSHIIMENETRLTAEWDASRPFADLIQRATAVHEFANDAGRPITNKQVMDALYYTVIFNSGVMCEEREKWDDKATADKTYNNFKTPLTTVQRKFKRRQRTTAKQGCFDGVNAIVAEQLEQANNALVSLVSAAAADRTQIVLLNQTIHTQNETIAALTKQYQTLGNKMNAFNCAAPTTNLPANAPSNRVPMLDDSNWLPNGHHKYDTGGYCWSHGYIVRPNHTSLSCGQKGQKPGHQPTATRENPTNGSTRGKPRTSLDTWLYLHVDLSTFLPIQRDLCSPASGQCLVHVGWVLFCVNDNCRQLSSCALICVLCRSCGIILCVVVDSV